MGWAGQATNTWGTAGEGRGGWLGGNSLGSVWALCVDFGTEYGATKRIPAHPHRLTGNFQGWTVAVLDNQGTWPGR